MRTEILGKNRGGECVYCGQTGAVTRDHIPPQNLFARPRPNNLITVPCCRNCNKGFELDDEYFRLAVTTGISRELFPKEFDLSIQAINKLKQPRKIKFAKRMLASFAKRPVYTHGGLFLGEAGSLELDAERVVGTVRRVVRGLFFARSGRRLPTAGSVWVWSDWFGEGNGLDPESMASLKDIFEALCTQGIHVVGKSVFRYSYLMDGEDPCASAWWLSFYEHRNFLAGTQVL